MITDTLKTIIDTTKTVVDSTAVKTATEINIWKDTDLSQTLCMFGGIILFALFLLYLTRDKKQK